MERVNQICRHPLWRESMDQIRSLERDRIFCKHDTAHLLDVARIAYLENLERQLGIAKAEIYAAALLHDIGRHLQYTEGIPHEEGSVRLAGPILTDCGFSREEQTRILSAISRHRDAETATQEGLTGLLYRADKASRACLFCDAQAACSWSREKKNLVLKE